MRHYNYPICPSCGNIPFIICEDLQDSEENKDFRIIDPEEIDDPKVMYQVAMELYSELYSGEVYRYDCQKCSHSYKIKLDQKEYYVTSKV
jgi:hypothetical protein